MIAAATSPSPAVKEEIDQQPLRSSTAEPTSGEVTLHHHCRPADRRASDDLPLSRISTLTLTEKKERQQQKEISPFQTDRTSATQILRPIERRRPNPNRPTPLSFQSQPAGDIMYVCRRRLPRGKSKRTNRTALRSDDIYLKLLSVSMVNRGWCKISYPSARFNIPALSYSLDLENGEDTIRIQNERANWVSFCLRNLGNLMLIPRLMLYSMVMSELQRFTFYSRFFPIWVFYCLCILLQVLMNVDVVDAHTVYDVSHQNHLSEYVNTFKVCVHCLDEAYECPCMGFTRNGYLCRHIFDVFRINAVKQIPRPYIKNRWRRQILPSFLYDIPSSLSISISQH
ncbi:hypothetical protein SSX86_003996 [Deinandra increscens subsp. villosa]|uniref:Protein FAR1-RELATED SEQUENCE n=1 Tax=Deinandra increscens subsp. villosa TaxID=3103831 RepID=A0AAP0DID6_9ASTR